MSDYQYYVILLFCFSSLYSKSDSQFTETPDSSIVKCSGDTANVRWNFNVTNIQSIQWFYKSTEMMLKLQASNPSYSNNYNNSVVEYVSDAEILLKALTTESTGSYSCIISYSTGTDYTNTINLIVYEKFSTGLSCQYVGGAITCTKPDSSVSLNATDDQGSVIDINKPSTSGNYSICMYGGAIECRDTFPTCTIVEVIIQGSESVTKCDVGKIVGIFIVILTFTQIVILLLILWCLKKKIKNNKYKKEDLKLVILLQIAIDFFVTAAIELSIFVYAVNLYNFRSDTDCNRMLIVLLTFAYAAIWKIITPLLIYWFSKSETKKYTTVQKPTVEIRDEAVNNKSADTQKDITGQKSTVEIGDETVNNKSAVEIGDETVNNKSAVVCDSVMLLVNKIDGEIPSDFMWMVENGKVKKKKQSKYIYGKQNGKCTLVIKSPLKEDSGIYQCVRVLQNDAKDSINVVLHVTDGCPFLVVNPVFWGNKEFGHLKPLELNNLVTEIKDGNITTENFRQTDQVDWICYSNPKNSKTLMGGKCCEKLKATDAGEYKCTVKLRNQTQTYFFNIIFLDPNSSKPNTNENVIGVPSMLNSSRNDYGIGRQSHIARHTGTSRQQEETDINKDEKVDLPNLIKDVQEQPKTPP